MSIVVNKLKHFCLCINSSQAGLSSVNSTMTLDETPTNHRRGRGFDVLTFRIDRHLERNDSFSEEEIIDATASESDGNALDTVAVSCVDT